MLVCLFFFNDTATTEIYTLSLHDALPISLRDLSRLISSTGADNDLIELTRGQVPLRDIAVRDVERNGATRRGALDRKSTRLNSSHANISYAVFCLKKKKKERHSTDRIVRR